MSQHQTNSGLWVSGPKPIPASVASATQPVHQQQFAQRSGQRHQAQVYDPATGMQSPQGGMLYRWPPKLPKAAWLVAGPAIVGVLAIMATALLFIGAVATNLFF